MNFIVNTSHASMTHLDLFVLLSHCLLQYLFLIIDAYKINSAFVTASKILKVIRDTKKICIIKCINRLRNKQALYNNL